MLQRLRSNRSVQSVGLMGTWTWTELIGPRDQDRPDQSDRSGSTRSKIGRSRSVLVQSSPRLYIPGSKYDRAKNCKRHSCSGKLIAAIVPVLFRQPPAHKGANYMLYQYWILTKLRIERGYFIPHSLIGWAIHTNFLMIGRSWTTSSWARSGVGSRPSTISSTPYTRNIDLLWLAQRW